MRILVLGTDAFGGHGGIARYNTDLITALCSYPDTTEVVALLRLSPVNETGPLPANLTYIKSGFDSKTKFITTVFNTVRKNPQFDLIVCAHLRLLPIAIMLKRWIRSPLCLIIYGVDVWDRYVDKLSRRIISNIDSFVSISQFTTGQFMEWARVNPAAGHLLPNAIHLDLYGPGPKNKDLLARYGLEGKRVLLTLGRLAFKERHKGFDEVMEAMPQITAAVGDVAYLVAGDGSDLQRLKEKAQSLHISDQVVFTGYVHENEKADHYRLADAYVMPSRAEGFGFVLLEAMACGIPVLASSADGSQEALLDGELGVIVDPDDSNAVAAGILETLRQPTGIVPPRLGYFAYPNFEQRCHAIVDQLVHSSARTLA